MIPEVSSQQPSPEAPERHDAPVDMDTLVSLCKRRGFVFPSSEIYGGLGSSWDYGPVGVELKQNVKAAWWRTFVQQRDDVVGLDAAILMHPQTWVASGHLEHFADLLVDCKSCRSRWRDTDLNDGRCPKCDGEVTEPRRFNTMFRTFVGPVEEEAAVVYLRPETAQGIFVNFDNVLTTTRKRIPFGIAQMGKAFRNEITTGNFFFRSREFEQMEIEYFVKPGTDEEWYRRWVEDCLRWYVDLGIRPERLRPREYAPEELAHYSKATTDIEYLFPMGWSELMGIANRFDYDLTRHAQSSGRDLSYFDDETRERYVPYVVEPSFGVDRAVLAFLLDAYHEEEVRGEKRVVLRLSKELAPVKVAVLPLSRNPKLLPTARRVYDLVREHFATQYDDAQSIGRRYRRQDEIGTPLAVTIDFQTVDEDDAVTIRDRDTMEQVRVPISGLVAALRERLEG